MSLFDDPAVIEAATHTACEATGLSFDGGYDRGESIALDILTAALAALDREALIEKAVLAMRDPDGPPYGCGDARLIEYVFARIGLIPDSPEGHGMTLYWNTEEINNPRYDWVAFKVCPDCGATWQGILRADNTGLVGAVAARCPDCDMEADSLEGT
jgi:hypothetical protein